MRRLIRAAALLSLLPAGSLAAQVPQQFLAFLNIRLRKCARHSSQLAVRKTGSVAAILDRLHRLVAHQRAHPRD